MHNLKYSSLIVFLALTVGSCKKEAVRTTYCDNLINGLIAEDVKIVSNVLRNELTFYSRENLNKLAATVSKKCNITASQVCFDCIYTMPAQSELRIAFNQAGTSIEKTIDISHTSANKMILLDIHN